MITFVAIYLLSIPAVTTVCGYQYACVEAKSADNNSFLVRQAIKTYCCQYKTKQNNRKKCSSSINTEMEILRAYGIMDD